MIHRLVRLPIHEAFREAFLETYRQHIHYMEDLPYCIKLDLYEDKEVKGFFYTVSIWDSEEGLEKYRSSEYFKDIWAKIKPWFSEKAEAWTLDKIEFPL